MTSHGIPNLAQVMNEMHELELSLAALYQACSEKFPEDQNFWLAIKRQEELHAEYIGKMMELIRLYPNEFRSGRPFNSVAIRNIKASVVNYTAQAKAGALERARALFIAKDIENSVLEANYQDIVSTDNVEYREIMERIKKDTLSHKNLFAAKVTTVRR